MEILHLQDTLDDVMDNWKNSYYSKSEDTWIATHKGSSKRTYKALLALPKPTKKEDIDKVIGDSSWTEFKCEECNEQVDRLMYFESKYFDGYEGGSFMICKDCLQKAMEKMCGSK